MDSPLFRVSGTLVIAGLVLLATGWLAWHAARRWGGRGLLLAWAGGTLAVTAVMAWRIAQQEAALGFPPDQASAGRPFGMFAPLWAVALGAQALVLRRARRHDAGATAPFAALAWRLVLAGFGGMLAYFILYALLDFAGLFVAPRR